MHVDAGINAADRRKSLSPSSCAEDLIPSSPNSLCFSDPGCAVFKRQHHSGLIGLNLTERTKLAGKHRRSAGTFTFNNLCESYLNLDVLDLSDRTKPTTKKNRT